MDSEDVPENVDVKIVSMEMPTLHNVEVTKPVIHLYTFHTSSYRRGEDSHESPVINERGSGD